MALFLPRLMLVLSIIFGLGCSSWRHGQIEREVRSELRFRVILTFNHNEGVWHSMSYSALQSSSCSLTIHPGSGSDGVCSYAYKYGPSGLAGLLRNKSTLLYAAFASLGGLTFG